MIIKPEYRKEMEYLNSNDVQYEWSKSHIDFMKEYGDYNRATFIPRGGLSYMPDEWEDVSEFNRKFIKETGLWTFQCSLKNYELTIQHFFENVLNKITQEVIHLEYYYESWENSIFLDLIEGKIVRTEKKGIKYKEYK
ncbi:hypothetical protein BSK59_15810 [Paenibacillus odorifer]|uniref:hypothetical protein n=1 Tax=Paenibacillus odorifer TaxID=189426 RepID=UPI00096CD239|nr:hypothetical protein [Paenibacillus odorifer]OME54046.1 hypothetical protein BSK59_15810 [Paenibacillus odorifer]